MNRYDFSSANNFWLKRSNAVDEQRSTKLMSVRIFYRQPANQPTNNTSRIQTYTFTNTVAVRFLYFAVALFSSALL